MSRPRLLPWALCLAWLVAGCGGDAREPKDAIDPAASVASGADCTVLAEIPGPEDFVVQKDDDGKIWRLLVSSQDRRAKAEGAIYRVSLQKRSRGLTGEMELKGRGDCSFRPHGVYLREDVEVGGETRDLLYVINHHDDPLDRSADRSCIPAGVGSTGRPTSVEVFAVGTGSLRMIQRLTSKVLTNGNDLAVDGGGNVFVTAPPTSMIRLVRELAWGPAGSKIVTFSCERSRTDGSCAGAWRELKRFGRYVNGIEIDGEHLIISTSIGGDLFSLPKDGGWPKRMSVFDPPQPNLMHDNFTRDESNRLLLASHSDIRKFAQHAINHRKASPSEVWLLPGDRPGEGKRIFYDDGTSLSGLSTAACVEDHLILGQVYGGSVLACHTSQCGTPTAEQRPSTSQNPAVSDWASPLHGTEAASGGGSNQVSTEEKNEEADLQ